MRMIKGDCTNITLIKNCRYIVFHGIVDDPVEMKKKY